MKKLLLLAAVFVATGTVASAQQVEQMGKVERVAIPLVPRSADMPREASVGKDGARPLEPTVYTAFAQVLNRRGTGGDTNRSDVTFPVKFEGSGTEFRGMGQLFNPSLFYNLYKGIYNGSSNIWFDGTGDNGWTDQEYIDQFKGAGTYTIEAIRVQYFRNPYNVNPVIAAGELYRVPKNYNQTTDFNGAFYKENGFGALRDSLKGRGLLVKEITLDEIAQDTTIRDDGSGNFLINPTLFDFSEEPIEFAKDETALMMLSRDEGTALVQPVGGDANETRPYTRIISFDEYRSGDLVADPNDPTATIDTRTGPLETWQAMGVVLFRIPVTGGTEDRFLSASQSLVFLRRNSSGGTDTVRSLLNTDMTFFGRVDLATGVSYHFGKDVNAQGLGTVSPNPVSSDARLPFSLNEKANVQLDLFTTNGEHIKQLAASTYIPGNYSVVVPVSELRNGAYVVRLIANDKVYTTKLNVVK